MKKTLYFIFAIAIALVLSSSSGKAPITIFMIGDSTMANKPLDKDNQERGWGQMLSGYFSDDIVIDNHAMNGRSSLSFINEGRWDSVMNKIKPGDYVIIQFGHNDEKPKPDRHTEPGSTFDDNLRKFCNEARSKGATPILMNAIVRRAFFENKNAVVEDDNFGKGITLKTDGDTLVETHILTRADGTKADYLAAPRNVAKELNVAFVDANKITHDYIQNLGPDASKALFCWIPAGTNLAAPTGREDNTHLNINGGRIISGLLAKAICEAVPALSQYYRCYDIVVAKDGSGNYFNVQDAVNAIPDYNKEEITILIQPGVYKEKLVVAESKEHIHMIAKTEDECIITYDDYASKPNSFGKNKGTSGSSSVYIYAPDFEADGITFENSASKELFAQTGNGMGQAVAILVKGDRAIFRHCKFLGHQDTLYAFGQKYASQSRQYYEDCYIEGTVDYIFGWATAVFNNCEMHNLGNGYVTAASTPEGQKYGYVFVNCKITGDGVATHFLGRPWRPYANVVYINCSMDKSIKPEGWNNWGKTDNEKTAYYAEYKSYGDGANKSKRAKWSHQLDSKQVEEFNINKVLSGDDEWNPIAQPKE